MNRDDPDPGLQILDSASRRLLSAFSALPRHDAGMDTERVGAVLQEVAGRLSSSYPFFHPLYAGQMLKPPHPVARLAYALAMLINPNNHALDGGPASSHMEKEAVAALADMIGWESHLGHLCGGGTMANLEGLWIASCLHPGKVVLASAQAHYTHARISEVLGIPFASVPTDAHARMDVDALAALCEARDVGTVVVSCGTTAVGAVDPLHEILQLRERYGFRIHVDAAYGGYFVLIENLQDSTQKALRSIRHADTCVIDPHKHGLQPYGCGCILHRDPAVGRFYSHDSPYTYFTSEELHLGEISLECSRPGAAAVALWATQRLLPLERGGEFATGLGKARAAAVELHHRLVDSAQFRTLMPPELDIVVWAPAGDCASEISRRTRAIFQHAARLDLHLSVAQLPVELLRPWWPEVAFDEDRVSCLRACLMKPEHGQWLDEIWERLGGAVHAANIAN